MKNILDELTELLSTDSRLVSDGKLLKNKIVELALAMDPSLLKLLLKKASVKKHFFTDVERTLVFDKIKFQHFVSNKAFLPDSYTAFKNKIGLVNENGDYISESKEVVLAWPYKDCILEGGQTKEDQKRDEIFWNYTLAPEDIDKLLGPKVFTNWKHYSPKSSGIANYIKDNNIDNIIIKGNNLLALSSLTNISFISGKVKLIYIDPPFNTGNDSFKYNDKFNHSTWLSFMRDRLQLAYKLLDYDGNIFIHMDINESHYMKVLCDEIFKRDNFVDDIIWSYGSPSGGRAAGAKPVIIHNYILHYAKQYNERKQNKIYTPYTKQYIKEWFKYKDKDGRPYQKRMRGRDDNGNTVWEKQYLDESKGLPLTTVWSDIKQVYADPRAYKESQRKHTELIKGFLTQKPEKLVKRIIEMSTNKGDLILDFFLGSGTTATVAHKMERKYIGIEQLDYDENDCCTRLLKVIKGDKTGISKEVTWKGGGSFIYCELLELNEKYIKLVKEVKSTKELLSIWRSMNEKGNISYKVDPKVFNENVSSFEELSLADQKRFLIEVLDKNQLYVNYSEIDDEDYKVSETDKKLNHMFYGDKP